MSVASDTCPVAESPSFELGTGETAFAALPDGADLWMVQGIQGGCHFPLSIRAHGFAERRLQISYRVLDAESRDETPSQSSQRVRLTGIAGSDECEYVGFVAYLIEPWTLADRTLLVEVTVTDDLGRSAVVERRVVARGKPGTICIVPPG